LENRIHGVRMGGKALQQLRKLALGRQGCVRIIGEPQTTSPESTLSNGKT
jgi:hypothetical protein